MMWVWLQKVFRNECTSGSLSSQWHYFSGHLTCRNKMKRNKNKNENETKTNQPQTKNKPKTNQKRTENEPQAEQSPKRIKDEPKTKTGRKRNEHKNAPKTKRKRKRTKKEKRIQNWAETEHFTSNRYRYFVDINLLLMSKACLVLKKNLI